MLLFWSDCNLGARVGTTADVTATLATANFNYFGGLPEGWLGDYAGDNLRPVWNVSSPAIDFDGAPLDVRTGGSGDTAPSLTVPVCLLKIHRKSIVPGVETNKNSRDKTMKQKMKLTPIYRTVMIG